MKQKTEFSKNGEIFIILDAKLNDDRWHFWTGLL